MPKTNLDNLAENDAVMSDIKFSRLTFSCAHSVIQSTNNATSAAIRRFTLSTDVIYDLF